MAINETDSGSLLGNLQWFRMTAHRVGASGNTDGLVVHRAEFTVPLPNFGGSRFVGCHVFGDSERSGKPRSPRTFHSPTPAAAIVHRGFVAGGGPGSQLLECFWRQLPLRRGVAQGRMRPKPKREHSMRIVTPPAAIPPARRVRCDRRIWRFVAGSVFHKEWCADEGCAQHFQLKIPFLPDTVPARGPCLQRG